MNDSLALFFGTLILEDVAMASAIGLVHNQKMSLALAFAICVGGIGLGDLCLFWLGRFSRQFSGPNQFNSLPIKKSQGVLSSAIFISRAIPGTRIPTYFGAGALGYPFYKFCLLTIVSVTMWVALIFIIGRPFSNFSQKNWLLFIFSFLIVLKFMQSLFQAFLSTHTVAFKWRAKAYLSSWRRWTHFEFWPAVLFYSPIVPMLVYLACKYRRPFAPLSVNPSLTNGGFIGESKWDLLRFLRPQDSSTLKAVLVCGWEHQENILQRLNEAKLVFPLIAKPDVGQRGFAVEVIRSEIELASYFARYPVKTLLQELSPYENEAGVFYIRLPEQTRGFIFSFTDKIFPKIVGDGQSRVGDLILGDRRAKIMASTYFRNNLESLDVILGRGESLQLSFRGNHCQGAIFKNGQALITPELEAKIDEIAKLMPDFYFGRFDIRYLDSQSLKKAEHFHIVEINGPGAEATHIWDGNETLLNAYSTLYKQWDYLFRIGEIRQRNAKPITKLSLAQLLKNLLTECYRVYFRA